MAPTRSAGPIVTAAFWLVVPVAVIVGGWLIVSVWRIERSPIENSREESEGDDPGMDPSEGVGSRGVNTTCPQRGAVLVELAFAMPLLVLLVVGGVDLTMATQTRGELQHLARQIAVSDLEEDEAASLAAAHDATLECFDQSTAGACFDDGLDGSVERRQAVLVATFDGAVLPDFPVRGSGVAVMPLT